MSTDNPVDVGLAAIRSIRDIWKAGKESSLIEFAKPTRVEPFVLIDADAIHLEAMQDVQQSLLNMFTGYYLQAAALLATVGNVQVIKQLDKLNPNRDVVENALNSPGWTFARSAVEGYASPNAHRTMLSTSYAHRLPHATGRLALEDDQQDVVLGANDKAVASVKDLTNLSVGKLINVEIGDGSGKKFTLPVNVRLIASSIPTRNLVHNLTKGGDEDHSMKERFHGWKSGRLSFIGDILFANDLIKAHRQRQMGDIDGTYAQMAARANKNAISAILSAEPSIANASNLVVMTERTSRELENAMGGRLSDFRVRERMLQQTSIMIMAVIDPLTDRVTFYHRSIPHETDVGVRDLKVANKGGGPDVGDILKAYQIGSAPRL